MINSPELFVKIDDIEIYIIAGYIDEDSNFKLSEKIILKIEEIKNKRIYSLETASNLIKKNILLIEQKINFTFRDLTIILNNLEVSFLNLSGFRKLNGTQISKENVTYILNSLKSNVDEFEKDKKILHIFNTKYCLDKKNLDNLPIGLFGDFYTHELSFSLINKNDFRDLENIFAKCSLRIKKILLDSYVKGSMISKLNPKVDTFFYIQIKKDKSKIFYIENDAIKNEQKFNFGSEIVFKDICKVTSLNYNTVRNIVSNDEIKSKTTTFEILGKKSFKNQKFKKIKKKLILDIAEARIQELSNFILLKNINFKCYSQNTRIIFLEIEDSQSLKYFKEIYESNFVLNDSSELRLIKSSGIEETINTAINITKFGWKKEAIPVVKLKNSFFSRIFKSIFQ